ncbi:hypothetical protein [Streptomyces sp. NPDC054888]
MMIPVQCVTRPLWLLILFLGGESFTERILEAPRRFLTPAKLVLRMSHDPARHERYLDREFGRISAEMQKGKYGWRTRFYHYVGARWVTGTRDRENPLVGVMVGCREYRGVPLSVMRGIARRHRLILDTPTPNSIRPSVSLRPAQWENM